MSRRPASRLTAVSLDPNRNVRLRDSEKAPSCPKRSAINKAPIPGVMSSGSTPKKAPPRSTDQKLRPTIKNSSAPPKKSLCVNASGAIPVTLCCSSAAMLRCRGGRVSAHEPNARSLPLRFSTPKARCTLLCSAASASSADSAYWHSLSIISDTEEEGTSSLESTAVNSFISSGAGPASSTSKETSLGCMTTAEDGLILSLLRLVATRLRPGP
mmetsp:Transcript_139168/g.259525  ORF Transcript_139168/g.259525 Transcript_139168/m.259525 type:complete len:213 (-) Transcript_139168:260-898(-)